MIVRLYDLAAAEGREADLRAALDALARHVRDAGCEKVDVMRDRADAARFVFIESWADDAAYDAGRAAIPKSAFAPVMAGLAGPPRSMTLESAVA